MHNVYEYFWRAIKRETENAYLVEVAINNRRDGAHLTYKWVSKRICKEVRNVDGFERFALVPVWATGNGVW